MKIKALLTCDKVIQDKDSNTPSLITVFQTFSMGTPPGVEIPTDAVIPREWALFSLWDITEEEEGPWYAQTMQVTWPDGTPFVEATLESNGPSAERLIYIARFTGFPAGQTGELIINAWVALDGNPVSDVAQTAISIRKIPLTEALKDGVPSKVQLISGTI